MKTKPVLSFILASIGSVGVTTSPSLAASITDTFTYHRTERGPLLIDEHSDYQNYPFGYWTSTWYEYLENQELDSEIYEYDLTWDPDFQVVTYVSNVNQRYEEVLTSEVYYYIYDFDINDFVEGHEHEYTNFLFETTENYYQVQSIPEPLTILGASAATVWGWLMRKAIGKQRITK